MSAVAIASVTNVAANPAPYYPVQYTYPTQPTYQQQPYCTITVSNYNNYNGYNNGYNGYNNSYGPATLTWTSTYATSGYISPTVGSVSGYGSMTVYPTSGQIYTMTVYGQGGSATCATPAYYYAQPVYTPPVTTYVPPVHTTPYVSLSQIPYTGFDFGPVGNAMYWMSLMIFAVAGAYLAIYFVPSQNTLGFARVNTAARSFEMPRIQMPKLSAVTTPVAKAAEVIEKHVVAPVKASIINLPIAEVRRTTIDSMNVIHSKHGEAPRIVIARA